MNYLDTSAIIKRFVNEQGSELVDGMMTGPEPVATAKVAFAEVFAALARRHRDRSLSDPEYLLACEQFEEDWRSYLQLELRDSVLFVARDVVRRRPLTGFDAIHLASALVLRSELRQMVTFAAGDRRLLVAAEAEGLEIVDIVSL